MGQSQEGTDANQLQRDAHWRGSQCLEQRDHANEVRARDRTSVPCSQQDARGGGSQPDSPISLDGGTQVPGRNMEPAFHSRIPFMLAACSSDHATSGSETLTLGATGPSADLVDTEVLAIRVLLNPMGTLCYANSVIIALAWMAPVSGSLLPRCRSGGYQFFKCLTTLTVYPLSDCPPFRWLLTPDWPEVSKTPMTFAAFCCRGYVHPLSIAVGAIASKLCPVNLTLTLTAKRLPVCTHPDSNCGPCCRKLHTHTFDTCMARL